ncbi:50S ribosomal protein L22 [Candidatus Nomurabacteria bacterium]|nr:50S ribosomal protein L22 [Candidatus Nomurabacteria bacterium]
MKAILKNYRQSPRKVRLLADLVRGKKATDALTTLRFVDKRASGPFAKVISSAIANAKQHGAKEEELFIKAVQVNKAPTFKRFMPRARGSASRINKRNSHISVELGVKK